MDSSRSGWREEIMTDARDQDNTHARRRFDGMTDAELAVFAYETLRDNTTLDGDDGEALANAVVDRGVLSGSLSVVCDTWQARAKRLAEKLEKIVRVPGRVLGCAACWRRFEMAEAALAADKPNGDRR